MSVKAPVVRLTRRYVMSLIRDAEAAAVVRTISLHEMQFETHWFWMRGEEYYTEAALELIIERVRDAHPGAAEAIEDAVATARERIITRAKRREKKQAGAADARTNAPKRGYWWERD